MDMGSREVSGRWPVLMCLAIAMAGCDAEAPRDTTEHDVSAGSVGGIGGNAGPVFAGTGGGTSAGGTGGTGGSIGVGSPGDDEFAGSGGSAGSGGADAGASTDAASAMGCPPGFECVTEPIFNALSGCLPLGGGLPPACTTDADCDKAGLPDALCLMEEETGLNGCAQVCTP